MALLNSLVQFFDINTLLLAFFFVVVPLYVLYQYFTDPAPYNQPYNRAAIATSKDFNDLRAKTFPPPYPNGWWKLCDVADFEKKSIITVAALGREFVVFKRESKNSNATTITENDIGVLDPHCPHVGAHLGNGHIDSNGYLKCPFHGWSFDTDGTCKSIPYCTAASVPSTAKTHSYKIRIWMGMVFVWYHVDGAEPEYQLAPPPIGKDWIQYGARSIRFDMHVAEMAENSADYYHFNYVHAPLGVPLIGNHLIARHETLLFFPEEEDKKHVSYFQNYTTIYLLNKYKLAFTRQKTIVTFEGPSIIHFDIETQLGKVHLIKTLLPISPFKLYTEDRWYAEKKVPRWLVKVIGYVAKGALEQDRVVWESKIYQRKPMLVSGDGPFPKHRRWFKQFYSGSSQDAMNIKDLEW